MCILTTEVVLFVTKIIIIYISDKANRETIRKNANKYSQCIVSYSIYHRLNQKVSKEEEEKNTYNGRVY